MSKMQYFEDTLEIKNSWFCGEGNREHLSLQQEQDMQ